MPYKGVFEWRAPFLTSARGRFRPHARVCSSSGFRHYLGVSDNLSSVTALREALERLPEGTEIVRMFAKLGLWSSELHRAAGERKAFPSEFSKLGAPELSDLTAGVVL